jgi:RNA polymerase primary sigma factor/RNA polymerase nonessential primary-like sigma factor
VADEDRTRLAARAGARPQDEDFDLIGQYLHQIASTPLLSASDEVELAKRIEAGVFAGELLHQDASGSDEAPSNGTQVPEQRDRRGGRKGSGGRPAQRSRDELEALVRDGEAAKDHMIRANLRLVVSAARKYHRRYGLSLLDLIQDGNLGLIRAVEKFDYTKGFKFSTYAMWWIRQAIERGRADHDRTIRLPMHVVESLSKIRRAERELQFDLGREGTLAELAAETGLDEDRIEWLRNVARDVVSLDTPVSEDGETRLGDLVEDSETPHVADIVERDDMISGLRSLVASLPPRQAVILTLRFGLRDGRARSLQEVSEEVGLTRERVRQLEKQALAELRNPERREYLLPWAS